MCSLQNQPRVPSASLGWPVQFPSLSVRPPPLALFRTEYATNVVWCAANKGWNLAMSEALPCHKLPESRAGSGMDDDGTRLMQPAAAAPGGVRQGDGSGICLSLASRRVP